MRVMAAAIAVLLLLVPRVSTGQTFTDADRWSVQAAGGATLKGGGHVLSAAFGYSPVSRLDLLLNVERTHLPFELRHYPDGYGITRGGTFTFASGELRLALRPPDRVSPFVVVGAGGGISRPTVNAEFPNPVTNRLRVLYFGGGVRAPLGRGFSLLADARAMLALEGSDSVLGVWPVRAGVAWRF